MSETNEKRMYTVIVADDEEEIRKGIIRRVGWERVGFRVIGEAENGADALELVEKLEPDLLLTDIRMPFLSGIDLARAVREVRPTVQIAFLSGYDDFSYAQQAIQYNIVSYMLKPISSGELEEELIKIKAVIDKKFEEFTRGIQVKFEIKKSEFLLPLLLDSFQQGRMKEEELEENALACGLLRNPMPDNMKYAILVVGIEDENGKDMTKRSSVNAIDMILKKYARYASCYLKGRVVSIIAATPAGLNKYLHIIVEEIVQSVERMMNLKCQIGVSRSMDMLTYCREGYLEAMNALSYSEDGQSSVYFIADEEKSRGLEQEDLQVITGKIESLLRGGTTEDMEAYLNRLEQEMRVGNNPFMSVLILISQIVASVYKVVYTVSGDQGIRRIEEQYPMSEMQELERTAENFQNMKKMCIFAKEMLSEQRKKSSERICEQAVQIINDRYTEQDISVISISEEVGVSPNYLSGLIKKNTGKTLVELLTGRRIEKAEELLCCTSLKIGEITEVCGYKDQYYFSHCFKKITGMSPNRYRREYAK